MPNLLCSVENCAYNYDYLCALKEIRVAGENAVDAHSTCCGSFRDRTETITNCEYCGGVTKETSVCCLAEHCAYNDSNVCCADGIDICGCGSHSSRGTECASFHAV